MKNKIYRIVMVEENRLLRDGIAAILNKQPDFKVVAAFGNSDKMHLKITESHPDILLLDIGCRCHHNIDLLKSVIDSLPDIKIIEMGFVPTQVEIINLIQAGVSGFIPKSASAKEFIEAIRTVARGDKVYPTNFTQSLFAEIVEQSVDGYDNKKLMKSIQFSRREKEVIELVAKGLSNKEIGQKLHLSTHTIKSHVHNLLEKMALKTRVQIALYVRSGEGMKNLSDKISLISE